jgi:RNA polymerase sigma-70 factor (ECF subfamily)
MTKMAVRDPERARLEIVLKLHKTCSSRVYGFLRKSVAPDIADDLTQETFLKLLQVRNIERKSISISYLFRIAQNLLRRRFNVTKRRREIMEKAAHEETSAMKNRSSEPFGIESIMLDEALKGLDVHEQETLRLIICDGLSYTQAARALNVPVSTINNWKHRALQKLRGTIDAADAQDSKSEFFTTQRRTDHARSGSKQEACAQTASGDLEEVSRRTCSGRSTGTDHVRVAG